MSRHHTYFPRSTAQQRKLLFETWEATESVDEACATAHLSRVTFYKWKPRFEEQGYAGLEQPRSTARKHQNRIAQPIAAEVIRMRTDHPDWGKTRISQEVGKAHNWVPVVSPNAVRRILQAAKLWPEAEGQKKTQKAECAMPNSPVRR